MASWALSAAVMLLVRQVILHVCFPGRRPCVHHSHSHWRLCRVHCSSWRLCAQTARRFRLHPGCSHRHPLLHRLQSSGSQVRLHPKQNTLITPAHNKDLATAVSTVSFKRKPCCQGVSRRGEPPLSLSTIGYQPSERRDLSWKLLLDKYFIKCVLTDVRCRAHAKAGETVLIHGASGGVKLFLWLHLVSF